MEEVYTILKGFIDPLFIMFVLLFISFFFFGLTARKKTAH